VTPEQRSSAALNRLCKWRMFFTGWWLGAQPKTEGPVRALRDLTDARLILRTEMSALTALLIRKGIITAEEMNNQVAVEADHLIAALERKYPGFVTTDDGLSMRMPQAGQTMQREGFPP
jgi:hypothetical protein